MKAGLCIVAITCVMGIASAQDTQQPPQTTAPVASKTEKTDKTASNGMPAEMKTQIYKGTLVDASCTSGGTKTAEATPPAGGDTNGANRSAGDSGSCTVSSSSTVLALQTKDGHTWRFDLVGNQRAQDELKNNKHWNKDLTAGKPIHATVSGVVNGDKLIVTSIH